MNKCSENCLSIPESRGGSVLRNDAEIIMHGRGMYGLMDDLKRLERIYCCDVESLENFEKTKRLFADYNVDLPEEKARIKERATCDWEVYEELFSKYPEYVVSKRKGCETLEEFIAVEIEEQKKWIENFSTYEGFTENSIVQSQLHDAQFTMPDLLAYVNRKTHGKDFVIQEEEEFIINYLNIAKIGTVSSADGIETPTCILTADIMPCVRFENWLKEGFHIVNSNALCTSDENGENFRHILPTAEQIKLDNEARARIEAVTGKPVVIRNHNLMGVDFDKLYADVNQSLENKEQ